MVSVFDPVVLGWKGRNFTIPADRVMGAISRVEDVITLDELQKYAERGTAPMVKLSMAYASVLRYAGASVRDEDVYAGMFAADTGAGVAVSIAGLLKMMLPPSRSISGGAPKTAGAPGPLASASRLSKRHSKRR